MKADAVGGEEIKDLTDLEAALAILPHLNNPCGKNNELAQYWVDLATMAAEKMTNPHAKELLESGINTARTVYL